MVFAVKDPYRPTFLLNDWESTVSAGVVEAVYPIVSVFCYNEVETSEFVSEKVSRL